MAFRYIRETDSVSSDEFDELRTKLPPMTPVSPTKSVKLEEESVEDDFSLWQLTRFNRTGNVDLINVLSLAFRTTMTHIGSLISLYSVYFVLSILAIRHRLVFVFVPLQAVCTLVGTSMSFSVIAGESSVSRFRFLFSKSGFATFSIQMVRGLLIYKTIEGALVRASSTTGLFLLLMLVNFLTYFHSCFIFDGLSLSMLSTCSFSLRVSLFAIPVIQGFVMFLFGTLLQAAGPFTFGLTAWISFFMRGFVFLAICGSGTNMTTIASR
jgi:hypothetical protein